jgi:non-ribosomal peptide synthetase component E (peptide arylation enzyme)
MQFQTVVKPELAVRWRAAGEWRNEQPFDILATQAARHPDRIAFVDGHGRISYGKLKDRIERCAAYLSRIGIGRGDVVTIQLPNRIAFPIVFFALELIGAVANKVNPDFRIRELDYILRFSGSKGFICPQTFKGFDYLGMARELRAAIPALTHVVLSDATVADEFNVERGIDENEPLPVSQRVRMSADEIYRIAFTSGTTGNPKCVLHSFNTTLPAVRQINRDLLVTEKDVQLVYLPVCLNWGYLCLLQAILSGSKAVLLERFSAKAALELIEREQVTYIATAPASIVAMLNQPDLSDYDVSSLRVVITGGASAAIETIRDYQARMPGHLIEL